MLNGTQNVLAEHKVSELKNQNKRKKKKEKGGLKAHFFHAKWPRSRAPCFYSSLLLHHLHLEERERE